jgi:hypothetical protein
MCPGQFEHISASVMNTRFKRMTQGSRLILGILLISMSRDSLAPAESVSAASLAGGVGTTSHPRNQRAGHGVLAQRAPHRASAAVATMNQAECGSHCSTQRQSSAATAVRTDAPLDAGAVGIAAGNAVGDAARQGSDLRLRRRNRSGGLLRAETVHERDVVGILAQNPIQLITGKTQEIQVLRTACANGLRAKQCRRGQRGQPRVFALPPIVGLSLTCG